MQNVLFGLVCRDIYTHTAEARPGCGLLHNAFHLQKLGSRPLLLTRLGRDDATLFLEFFRRNNIAVLPDALIANGASPSIKITVQPTGEAVMSAFSPGVWHNFRLHPAEEAALARARHVHSVLVAGVTPHLLQLSRAGTLSGALVSADLLSFRNFTVESFAQLLPHLDVAFIGWKGDAADPTLAEIRQVTAQHSALVVVTLGERGVQVFDSRTPGAFRSPFFAVQPVAVTHNTNGCGDAFIAHFLHEYWRSRNLAQAVEQGKIGGAHATRWPHALPESAYGQTMTNDE